MKQINKNTINTITLQLKLFTNCAHNLQKGEMIVKLVELMKISGN